MHYQRGQAAIIGITALTVVGLIVAIVIAAMSLSKFRMTDDGAKGNEVFTASEAALNDTLMRIKKDPVWPPSISLPYTIGPAEYLNGVTVTIVISEAGEDRQVVVTGVKGQVTRKLQAIFYTDTGLVNIIETEP